MKKDLILIGGGGHCLSVIDVIEQSDEFKVRGILDRPEKVGSKILGYPILGSDKDLSNFKGANTYFLITLGQIETAETRKSIYLAGKELGLNWATLVSHLSYVSKHAVLGEGTSVLHGAIVNAGAKVGANCILNTKCLVEHEAIIGDHCHIATGAVVNGQCHVGAESFVGSLSVLRQNLILAPKSFVQAGSFATQVTHL